jgi:hypothetical protein
MAQEEEVPSPVVRVDDPNESYTSQPDPPDDDGPPVPRRMPSMEPPLSPLNDGDDFHDAVDDTDVVEKVTEQVEAISVKEDDTPAEDEEAKKDTAPEPETPKTPKSNSSKEFEAMSTPLLNPKVRDAGFQELRSYEAKRRSIYLSKLNSSSLYWRSFRDLLSKAYQETERAEELVKASVVANKAYGAYLAAAAEDRIDRANGKPVDERKGKRMQEDKTKRYNRLGGGGLIMGMTPKKDGIGMDEITRKPANGSAPSTPQAKRDDAGATGLRQTISIQGLPDDSLVNKLIASTGEMAEHFQENVSFVEDVVLIKLIELRKELECEVNIMSLLGDNTISELERAEEEVQYAWGKFCYKILVFFRFVQFLIRWNYFLNRGLLCLGRKIN